MPGFRIPFEALDEICRRRRVKSLWLFGSAAGDQFDPDRSDIDVLVEFLPIPFGEHRECFFGLEEDLCQLFGRRVDLVAVGAIRNPIVRESILKTRVPLYAAA